MPLTSCRDNVADRPATYRERREVEHEDATGMRITLLAAGTQGDVNLFVALALGLKESGHQARLAVPGNGAFQLNSIPLEVCALTGHADDMMASVRGRKWLAADAKSYKQALAWLSHDRRHDRQRDLLEACMDSDALLFHPAYAYEAAVLSEKLQKPLLFLCPFPCKPAAAGFGSIFAGAHTRRKRADANEWRSRLGLAPCLRHFPKSLEQQRIPMLHAYSPNLAPLPGEWGRHHYQPGAIQSNRHRAFRGDAQAEVELRRWLDEGGDRPLVFFGYDRMPLPDMGTVTAMVASIAKQLDIRAVVATGDLPNAAASPESPESVYIAAAVDCRGLFPRCACAVHHGGAEMTHLAAAAGIPSIVVSAFDEEAGWGERLEALGIGRHVPYAEMTQEQLLAAIRDVLHGPARRRSELIGQRVRSENGLHASLAWLEQALLAAPVYRNE